MASKGRATKDAHWIEEGEFILWLFSVLQKEDY